MSFLAGVVPRSLQFYYLNIEILEADKLTNDEKKSYFFRVRLHEELGHLLTGLWGCINDNHQILWNHVISATPPNSSENVSASEEKDYESGYRMEKCILGGPQLDLTVDSTKNGYWRIISDDKIWSHNEQMFLDEDLKKMQNFSLIHSHTLLRSGFTIPNINIYNKPLYY